MTERTARSLAAETCAVPMRYTSFVGARSKLSSEEEAALVTVRRGRLSSEEEAALVTQQRGRLSSEEEAADAPLAMATVSVRGSEARFLPTALDLPVAARFVDEGTPPGSSTRATP